MKRVILPLLVIVAGVAAQYFIPQYAPNEWMFYIFYGASTLILFLLGSSMADSKSSSSHGLRKLLLFAVYVAVALYYLGVFRISEIDDILFKIDFSEFGFWMLFVYLGYLSAL